ncbi:hypothetical protein [Paenibacillus lignilyticus]|uniref:Beta propeller repeat-containing protein n=1 Tax=Paenibacillus lignilyticus TaxID=1172615 RepID=A0ABS5C9T9_9BACL|nr:hypothetical protein [Paenibacillus lignilyticus]MBP3962755.1 hypothetical protein [Paenibacillus lignilyticus]
MSKRYPMAISAFLVLLLSMTGCGSTTSKPGDLAKGDSFQPLEKREISGWQGSLDGDRLVTRDKGELTVTDLLANKQLASIPVQDDAGFDISGNFVVWSDLRNEKTPLGDLGSYDAANADIFLYNLSTREERQLTTDPSAQINPKIWGNYIVWMDNATDAIKEYPSHWQLVLYNIDTGEQKTITSESGGHTNPDIDAGNVVWENGHRVTKRVLRAGENVPENNTDIYLYRIETGETTPIAAEDYKEGRPQVSGSLVTWEVFNGSYAGDVFVHDIGTGKTTQVTHLDAAQRTPVINGHFVAWMDERNGSSTHDVGSESHNSDIYLADLDMGTETVVSGEGPQINPLISDHWIVFGKSSDVEAVLTAVRYR